MGNKPYSALEKELIEKYGHDKTDIQLIKILYGASGIERTVGGIGKQRIKQNVRRSNHALYSMPETCKILETSDSALCRLLTKVDFKIHRVGQVKYLTDKQIELLLAIHPPIPQGYILLKKFSEIVGLCDGAVRKQIKKGKMNSLILRKGTRYFVPEYLVEKYKIYMKMPTVRGKLPLRTDWNKFFDFIHLA